MHQNNTSHLKNEIKKIGLAIIKTYFTIRSLYPVWRILNREAIRTFTIPHLNAVQKRILHDLHEKGIATALITELFDDAVLTTLISDFIRLKTEQKGRQEPTKRFLTSFIKLPAIINTEDNFIKFILDPKIIDIANSYLGMQSKFYCYTINTTNPVKEGEQPRQSQRWHRDPQDKKLCKLFLYLSDVDEVSGPFMYVTHSAYGMKYGKLFPQQPPIGYYPPDGTVEKSVDPKNLHSFTGTTGTIIFADTAGLHKGGYATQKERIMLTAGFRPPHSVTNARVIYPKSACYQLMPGPKMRFSRKLFTFHVRWNKALGINPYNE